MKASAMSFLRPSSFVALATATFLLAPSSEAQSTPPDDTVLGTVEVDGSGRGLPPLPKLGFEPVLSSGSSDFQSRLVMRRDFELSGQFDVLAVDKAPDTTVARDAPIKRDAWKAAGAEYVVRSFADEKNGRVTIIAEGFFLSGPARTDGKADLRMTTEAPIADVRMATHRLVDQVLGGLTGRPGGFASRLTYTAKLGKWRRAFVVDSDGFEVHPESPADALVISPTFGNKNQLYYALSTNYSPFRIAYGPEGKPFPLPFQGNALGIAFSPERDKIALTVMRDGKSFFYLGDGSGLKEKPAGAQANHPTFGPLGKLAYVGGAPTQRVYVDDKPMSPGGFNAAAPTFCDAPQGLFVLYSVGIRGGDDIVASDAKGGGLRRLTQRKGSNTYPACSPDGRLVAFFATQGKEGPGLYLMPFDRPWLAKRIANEVGESLQWAKIIPEK